MFRVLAAVVCLSAVLAASGGCGGEDSAFSEDEISEALNVRFEGADNLYSTPEGDCIVVNFLTSSGEVEDADTGSAEEAVAATPNGDAGVVFGGVTSVDPDTCASYAEDDLATLGE